MRFETAQRFLVLATILLGCYVVGCDSSDDRGNPNLDTSPEVIGCGVNDATVCADMSALTWGDCGESLGYAYIDGRCTEVIGCNGDNDDFCLFESAESCNSGCLAADLCGFDAIENGRNPNWPANFGDTDPSIAECNVIFVCYDPSGGSIIEELYTDVDVFIEPGAPVDCPPGTEAWDVAHSATLPGANWDRVCAYSLLEGTEEVHCWN